MKKSIVLVLISVFVFAAAGLAVAGNVDTPTDPPEGVSIVSADRAQEMMKENKMVVFDMRKALNYGKGHLPGAVSLPYKWTTKGDPSQRTGEFDMSKLPKDKNQPIVFHSDGPSGWKSYYASKAAAEAGYKNVNWLREGFALWNEKGYPVER